jgi:hypothetical protein
MVVANLLHTLAFPLYLIVIEKAEEFQFPPLLPNYDFSNAIVIAKAIHEPKKFVFNSLNNAESINSEHISVFGVASFSGPDGNRTRVQKPIPCPSTSLVYP